MAVAWDLGGFTLKQTESKVVDEFGSRYGLCLHFVQKFEMRNSIDHSMVLAIAMVVI